LARRFRELAGFTNEEIDDIAALSEAALQETKARRDQLRREAAAGVATAAAG
jgi:hypothetical protein